MEGQVTSRFSSGFWGDIVLETFDDRQGGYQGPFFSSRVFVLFFDLKEK
jgi:hypothetical protein